MLYVIIGLSVERRLIVYILTDFSSYFRQFRIGFLYGIDSQSIARDLISLQGKVGLMNRIES